MSITHQTTGSSRSNDNFTAIFQAASDEYQRTTGKLLDTHPFATQLDGCDSPETVLKVFRTQAQAFSKFHKGDEKLMKWLDPVVYVVFTFSETLGEGIALTFSPAKTIFTGIGVLFTAAMDVVADNDTLTRLFERIHSFLQRLNKYIRMPLASEWTELLGKIMATILSILALSTKAMTERRIKKVFKKLGGRRDVDDAFLRLDSLTRDETLIGVAEILDVAFDVNGNVQGLKVLTEDIRDHVQAVKERMDERQRNQLQEKLQTWLSPPDPSINHNNARKTQHCGTASWFIQGRTFREWKENGSLLWIQGNPGAGKSILCSAIIEDIKKTLEERSALVAYHYFDFKDASKRHVHGLLASLLFQLCDDCDPFQHVLHELYKTCREGSERPSDTALVNCLKTMVELPGRLPIFIIMDALDECPNTTGTPSARDEVLDFVEDLVVSNDSNLFLCITSRPEQDIQTVFNPLTSASGRVALHEECGQKEDIYNYIRSFVSADRAMRRWREEDKELVINTLSERAGGMFRWVFCQLDNLRRCFPPSIRKTLDELPMTLDETYARTLEGIPKQKSQHAHRLFQCLVAAVRPLHVEELAEIFAIGFDLGATANFMEGWRPENPEEAILSACSTLIAVVDDEEGSKIVQFSHFSVKEFLVSERLRTLEVGNIRDFHIHLDAAHTILAQVCLTVLLQLDRKMNKKRIATYPLALYAAQHWFSHAKYEDVASQVQDAMEQLFDPTKPYLAAWVWIHDVDGGRPHRSIDDLEDYPSRPKATALYYAMSCGLSGLIEYLMSMRRQDINAQCGVHGTPLHVASRNGHFNAVSLLLDHGADLTMVNNYGNTALCAAYDGGHLEVMRLLLDRGAAADVRHDSYGLLTHDASCCGRVDAINLLLRHNADVNATSAYNRTPLHWAAEYGHANVAQVLLEHGADTNALCDHGTPLERASFNGYLEVARLLLDHGADVHIRDPSGQTPLQEATRRGRVEIAQLLLEYGAKKE